MPVFLPAVGALKHASYCGARLEKPTIFQGTDPEAEPKMVAKAHIKVANEQIYYSLGYRLHDHYYGGRFLLHFNWLFYTGLHYCFGELDGAPP